MNRTDRLYAVVEELRAVAPRTRSARWLADRFEVSTRTIERDVGALQQSGVPIYAETGRAGGYAVDKAHTLPPVNLTPDEALALAVALRGLAGTPFHRAGRSALTKLVAVMAPADVRRAEDFAARISLVAPSAAPAVPAAVVDAVAAGHVLDVVYEDRNGVTSHRVIEPVGYLGGTDHWYLLAWCRRRAAMRAFRVDRVHQARPTGEVAPCRTVDPADWNIPERLVTRLTVRGG